ncbi:MAG: fibronectin type III domain-containing protein [Paludibacteraceae bacterium]|nr:fibronectin type III domain-containing protein [Paludibacteraceae bacterium]
MGTKIYSILHRLACTLAFVAAMLSPRFVAETQAVCSKPADLSVTNLSATTATLTWDVAASTYHVYDIIVSSQDIATGSLASVTASTAGVVVFQDSITLQNFEYPLTGLTAGSHYYAYLRQDCSWDYQGFSDWAKYEFYTPCLATSVLPVTADFDGGIALPSCWSTSGVSPIVQSAPNNGTGNAVKMNATGDKGGFLYSPVFSGAAQAYYLTAKVCGNAGSHFSIGVAAASDLNDVLGIYEGTIAQTNVWQDIDYVVPAELHAALAYSEYVLVFQNAAADGVQPYYLDEIVISALPSCISPTGLNVTAVGENWLTLSWNERGTATSWKVEVTSANGTTTLTANTNPFILVSLNANTAYQLRVKSVCGANDESEWSPAVTAKTSCGVMTLPYSENFNSYAGNGSTSTRPATAAMPDCWDWEGDDKLFCMVASSGSYTFDQKGLFFSGYNTATVDYAYAILPAVDAENEVAQMLLKYKYESTTAGGDLVVGYLTTLNNTASFVAVETLARSTSFTDAEINFPAMSTLQVAIRYAKPASSYYYAGVDNIVLRKAPTCIKPTGLALRNVGQTTAELTWTAGGTENHWELTYKLNSEPVQTVQVGPTPSYTITGLTNSTEYNLTNVTLRAVCSDTDSSDVVTLANTRFTTQCDLIDLPYTQGFDASAFPGACWTPSYHLAGTSGGWSRNTSAADVHTGTGSAKLADAAVGNRNVIATPFFHSDAPNTLRVSFWVKRFSDSYTKPIEGVRVWVNTTALDTLGGTPIIHVARHHSITADDGIMVPAEADAGWYNYVANIPMAGDVCLLFEGISEYGNYSIIDDITIEEVPSCDRPLGVIASALSANEVLFDITDRDELHTAWEVVVGATGFNPNEATPIAITDKNATVTIPFQMTGQASYDAYVRTVCADDDKSVWQGPSTFVYTDWSVFASGIQFTSPGPYPWTLNLFAGEYFASSTNQHVVSSNSDLIASVNVPENTKTTISFSWTTSSYSSYEGFVIYIDENEPTNSNYDAAFGKNAGTYGDYDVSGSYNVVFTTPGIHTIRFRHMYSGTYAYDSYGDSQSKILEISRQDVGCVEPSVFNMGTITSTSAVLNWNNTGADNWEVVLYTEPQSVMSVENALAHMTATESTVTFDNLTQNTQYFAYVRSHCGENPSDWSKAVVFRTECEAREIPYVESFENPGAELCWKVIGNAVSMSATSAAFDNAKALQVYNDSIAGMLVSPRLNATTLADYEVSLAINLTAARYHGALKPLTIGVMTDPSDVATYIDLGEIVIPSAGSWKEYRFSLAALATPDYADWANAQYVVISMSDSATYSFDAISVASAETCPKPTALDVQHVGEDAVVDWVSDAVAHYAEVATLTDEVLFAGNVQKPFTPQGLEGNTSYKVRVRAICDGENSSWSSWLTFKTPCSLSALPFSENFDSYSAPASSYSVAAAQRVAPDCWNIVAEGTSVGSIMTSSLYASSSNKCMMFYGKEKVYNILPTINAANTVTRLRVTHRTESTSASSGKFVVGYLTNPANTATFVALDTLPQTTTKTQAEVIFPAMQYLTAAIVYVGGTASNWYAAFDDIIIDEAPSCLKPTGLAIAAIETESVKLTWNAGGSETSWQLTYQVNNEAETTVVVTTPEYTIEGLAPASDYSLSVSLVALCSETEQSDAIGGTATFKTPCNVFTLPFEENFANGIDDCWSRYYLTFTDGVSTAAASTTTSGWNRNTNVFTDGGVKVNVYGTTCNYWIVTPSITISDAQATLSFDAALTTYGGTGAITPGNQADDRFIVAVSTDGNTWTMANATVWSNAEGADYVYDEIDAAGSHFELPMGAYVGQTVRVAFYGESTVSGGDNDLHISNIVISAPVSCERPQSVSVEGITENSATVVINDAEGTAWEYVLNDVNATPVATYNSVFDLTGLTPQTRYTLYVRRVCAPGNESAWRSVSFLTSCGATPLPLVANFNNITSGVPDCWDNSVSDCSHEYNFNYYYDGHTGGCLRFNAYSAGYGETGTLISPAVTNGDATNLTLSFFLKNGDEATLDVYVSTDGGQTFPMQIVADEVGTANWEEYEVNFTVPDNSTIVLKFVATSDYGMYRMDIDDIQLRTAAACMKPTALRLSELTSTTVKLQIVDSEEATAWEYVIDDQEATPVAVSDPTLLLTDLAPASEFTVYVRRVCGPDEKSAWVSANAFTTPVAVDEIYETFDVEPILAGWVSLGTTNSSYPSVSLSGGVDGTQGWYMYAYDYSPFTGIFAMPEITGNLADYRFLIDAKKSAASAAGDIVIGVADAVGATITYVDTITPNSSAFATYVADFTAYTGTGKFPILRINNMQTTAYLDNIVVEPIPSCERPQGITILATTGTTMNLLINDSVSAHNAWEVMVVTRGAGATGTPVLVSDKNVTIPGSFISGNEYDIYVRTVCDENETSSWFGPVSYKYVDYSAVTSVPMQGVGSYPWTINGSRLESTNQGVQSSNSDIEATFVVPEGTRATVSFEYYVSSEATYDYLCMYIDDPTYTNYNTTFGKKGNSTGVTGTYSFDLSEGTHQVRWRYHKDSSGDQGDDKAQIWNIQVQASTFFTPLSLAATDVTPYSAKLTWAGCNDAVRHQVRLMSDNLNDYFTTTDNYLDVTELEPATTYQFRVRSFAATNDSTAWSAAYVFQTPCLAMELPLYEDFNNVTSIPDCWNNIHTAGSSSVVWSIESGRAYINYQSYGNVAALATPQALFEAGKTYRIKFDTEHTLYDYYEDETHIYMAADANSPAVVEFCNMIAGGTIPSGQYSHYYLFTPEEDATLSLIVKRIFDSDYPFYLDNVVIEEVPACDKPDRVDVMSIAPDQVAIAITDNDPEHELWQVAFGAQGFDPNAEGAQVVDALSKTLFIVPQVTLVENNFYDVYARTICSENETSPWTPVKSIKYIDFSAISDIYLEVTGEYPWEQVSADGLDKMQSTNQGVPSTTSDMSATVVVAEGEVGVFSFNYYASSEESWDYLSVFINNALVTELGSNGEIGNGAGETGTYTVALEPGVYNFRWTYRKDSSGDDGDDLAQVWGIHFLSTSAWAPMNFELVSAEANSAVIAWNSCPNTIKNEVSLGNQILETATDTIELTGLAPNSTYTIQVRSILESDTTAWSSAFSFRTACMAISLPYAEDFEEGYNTEDLPVYATTPDAADIVLPYCWNFVNNQAVTSPYEYPQAFLTANPSYVSSGDNALFFKSSGSQYIYAFLPVLDITESTTVRMSFYYRNEGTSTYSNGPVQVVKFNADNEETLVTTTTLASMMTQKAIDNLELNPGDRLAFRYKGGSDNYYASVDDIRISKIAFADTVVDQTCSNYDYSGYGFEIPQSRLTPGERIFTMTELAQTNLAADTVRTLKLIVNAPSVTEFRDTVCANEPYSGYGFNIASADPLRTTPYVRQLTNAAGCDSTVTLTLFVPNVVREYSAQTCEGTPYIFGDTILYTSGVYTRVAASPYDCDSVITVRLTVRGTHAEIYDSICPGQSYFFNNELIYEPGVYTETTLRNGCDSVTTLYLSYAAPIVTREEYDICSNQVFNYPVAIPGLHDNLFSLTEAGVYRDTIQTEDGCSEVIEVTLLVNPVEYDTIRGQVAEGEPFVYGAQTYTKAGTYEQTLATEDGCDKFVTIILVAATGLENVQVYDLEIAPNPVNIGQEAIILTDLDLTDDYLVHVYDAVGKLVARSSAANGRIPALSAAGIYTVRITAGDKQYQSKLVVK